MISDVGGDDDANDKHPCPDHHHRRWNPSRTWWQPGWRIDSRRTVEGCALSENETSMAASKFVCRRRRRRRRPINTTSALSLFERREREQNKIQNLN